MAFSEPVFAAIILNHVVLLVAVLFSTMLPTESLVPSYVFGIFFDNKKALVEPNCYCCKVVKIPDPLIFHASIENIILYENWYLQMLSKISINKSEMLTKKLKWSYLVSCTTGNALVQLKSKLCSDATRLFTTVDEIFEVLTAAYGNTNQKQKNKAKYQNLRQGTQDFSAF